MPTILLINQLIMSSTEVGWVDADDIADQPVNYVINPTT
jgi:hypothetical protein